MMPHKFFLLCLLAFFWLLPSSAQDDENLVTIRAIWNNDVFILINTSSASVDLTNLRFESSAGAIVPTDWQMSTDPRSGDMFTLNSVRPGACLVAYLGIARPQIPDTVSCTQVVAQFPVTTTSDLIWSVTQGGFTPSLGDTAYDQCSIRVTSCDILVNREGTLTDDEDQTRQSVVNIRAIWTPELFVLINISGRTLNLSDLSLISRDGAISGDNWEMDFSQSLNSFYTLDNVLPGLCLVAYFGSERPELPNTINCSDIMGRYVVDNTANLIWDVTQGGFTPRLGESDLTTCSIQRTSCEIPIPNPDVTSTSDAGQETVSIEIADESLIIRNNTQQNLDLTTLRLASEMGEILPENWDGELSEIRPGDCLVAYIGSLPQNLQCQTVRGEYVGENAIWQAALTVYLDDEEIIVCEVGESCSFNLP